MYLMYLTTFTFFIEFAIANNSLLNNSINVLIIYNNYVNNSLYFDIASNIDGIDLFKNRIDGVSSLLDFLVMDAHDNTRF